MGRQLRIKLDPVRVVIIGAGIGGLAAAVALRRVGIETLVIERVAGIREVGAGLSIWSNAVNALRELGLEASVMASRPANDVNMACPSRWPSYRTLGSTIRSGVSLYVHGHPEFFQPFFSRWPSAGS